MVIISMILQQLSFVIIQLKAVKYVLPIIFKTHGICLFVFELL